MNEAVFIDNKGTRLSSYRKSYLIPGILVWGMLFDMIRITVISIRKSRRSKKAESAGEKI